MVSFWVWELGGKFLGMGKDLVVFGMRLGGKFLGMRGLGRFCETRW